MKVENTMQQELGSLVSTTSVDYNQGTREVGMIGVDRQASASLASCTLTWIMIFLKSLVVVIPVLFFFWIYYLPAIVLRKDILCRVQELLYEKLRIVIFWISNYGYITSYGVNTFGFYYCKKSITAAIIPGVLLGILLDANTGWLMVNYVIVTAAIGVASFKLICGERLPLNPSHQLYEQFERLQKLLIPLVKVVLMVAITYGVMMTIYLYFLQDNFMGKFFLLVHRASSSVLPL
eukprot:TRINITY_DN11009_c0_g1_i1.p1 TRINITY_DN11009_c0_g1~~TRINITY_DN11009_c0_g1_i1.p1  ORF type:complete len:235 (-),score=19.13 TRINITY_DN11009_c0_g1_i1:807-1511(-)